MITKRNFVFWFKSFCLVWILLLIVLSMKAQDTSVLNSKGFLICIEKECHRFEPSSFCESDLLFSKCPIDNNCNANFDSLFNDRRIFPAILNRKLRSLNVILDSNCAVDFSFLDTLTKKPFFYIRDSLKVFQMKVDLVYKKIKMSRDEYKELHKTSVSGSNLSSTKDNNCKNVVEVLEILNAKPLKENF